MADIFSQAFAVYEKLAAAKMESLRSSLNSHNHGAGGGATIDFTTIPPNTIYGTMIVNNAITSTNIATGQILLPSLYLGTIVADQNIIHLSHDGYAVYAPDTA